MGVSIVAYSKLEYVPDTTPEQAWDSEDDSLLTTMAYAGFEASTRGLVGHNAVDADGFIAAGVYRLTDDSRTADVMSSSYTGYGLFREKLAALVGLTPSQVWADPAAHSGDPFFELINFADNEGTIGPDAAGDLLQDFRDHEAAAELALDAWEMSSYKGWIEGLALATDHGAISFG